MREPLGVVALITPWNFPIAIPAWKIAPALAFGNTVVFKPASLTPLCAVRLIEALAEAGLPAGRPQPRHRQRRARSAIRWCATSAWSAISFTGSNAVGAELRKIAAERGAKLQLELGGKNPAIVLADADLEHALHPRRQRRDDEHRPEVHRHQPGDRRPPRSPTSSPSSLLERIRALKVGDPLAAETQIGPLIAAEAAERVAGEIERGEARRAPSCWPAAGGCSDNGRGKGHFVAPTLFAGVDPGLAPRPGGALRPGARRHPGRRLRRGDRGRQPGPLRTLGLDLHPRPRQGAGLRPRDPGRHRPRQQRDAGRRAAGAVRRHTRAPAPTPASRARRPASSSPRSRRSTSTRQGDGVTSYERRVGPLHCPCPSLRERGRQAWS